MTERKVFRFNGVGPPLSDDELAYLDEQERRIRVMFATLFGASVWLAWWGSHILFAPWWAWADVVFRRIGGSYVALIASVVLTAIFFGVAVPMGAAYERRRDSLC
jgi:hypothetical protein